MATEVFYDCATPDLKRLAFVETAAINSVSYVKASTAFAKACGYYTSAKETNALKVRCHAPSSVLGVRGLPPRPFNRSYLRGLASRAWLSVRCVDGEDVHRYRGTGHVIPHAPPVRPRKNMEGCEGKKENDLFLGFLDCKE